MDKQKYWASLEDSKLSPKPLAGTAVFEVELTSEEYQEVQKALQAVVKVDMEGDMKGQNEAFLEALKMVSKYATPADKRRILAAVQHVSQKVSWA